ncbi:IclR family transcriptional regulator [Arvimicrobium flavum]|uniref:IclR family transcriptional regulator n=1 Tax=Arvimicrobium flavum TaxID=3393320 RepID=UPI00237C3F3E|nr:IclR family transcriptional regulator [Mesorhizobium shangrilense]
MRELTTREARPAADGSAVKIKSAERVLDVFECLGGEPDGLTFPELVKRLEVPKSSLHGLLAVLAQRQYLVFDPETRRYSFGVQLFEHGRSFLKQHVEVREAKAAMAAIVAGVNETAQLGLLRGAEGVNLATVECSHQLRMQLEVGRRFPAHATSIGKVLLAHLPESEARDRVGSGPLARFTENTFVDPEDLVAELRRIRQRGFSLDTEECIPGVFCVGIPIAGNSGAVLTGMSVTIPTSRLNGDLLARALSGLCVASLEISRRMGVGNVIPQLQELCVVDNAARALHESPARRWLEK